MYTVLGRSVNPITTRVYRLCPPHYYCPPPPYFWTLRRLWLSMMKYVTCQKQIKSTDVNLHVKQTVKVDNFRENSGDPKTYIFFFKVHIFDWQYVGQIIGGDFAKFCGLLSLNDRQVFFVCYLKNNLLNICICYFFSKFFGHVFSCFVCLSFLVKG